MEALEALIEQHGGIKAFLHNYTKGKQAADSLVSLFLGESPPSHPDSVMQVCVLGVVLVLLSDRL